MSTASALPAVVLSSGSLASRGAGDHGIGWGSGPPGFSPPLMPANGDEPAAEQGQMRLLSARGRADRVRGTECFLMAVQRAGCRYTG